MLNEYAGKVLSAGPTMPSRMQHILRSARGMENDMQDMPPKYATYLFHNALYHLNQESHMR